MISRRAGVDDDIAELALYLLEQSGEPLATRFIDPVERALIDLARTPRIGSLKSYRDPNLAGVRSWWVKGFPNHLVYYLQSSQTYTTDSFASSVASRDICCWRSCFFLAVMSVATPTIRSARDASLKKTRPRVFTQRMDSSGRMMR